MFVLDLSVENVTRLVASLLSKLSDLEKIVKSGNNKSELKKDKFVISADKRSEYKSTQDLLFHLLGFISNKENIKNKKPKKGYSNYLRFLLSEFCGGMFGKDGGFSFCLNNSLSLIFGYLDKMNFEEEDDKQAQARQRAKAALASIDAAHPMTALKKLIDIAKDSSVPSDIRTLVMALINDALSYLKGQDIDNKTAGVLVNLLNNTPSDVREVLYSALKDAKIIEGRTKSYTPYDVDSRHNRFFKRNLTIA